MFMRKPPITTFVLALSLGSSAAFAQAPNLGKPIDPAEIAAWDISILPDGTGLPPGSGTPAQGAPIYAQKCAMCHGIDGKGGVNAAVVGGGPIKDMESAKTIANNVSTILTKLRVPQRTQAIVQAREAGLGRLGQRTDPGR